MVLRTDKAIIPIRDDIKSHSKIGPKCEQVINLLCNYEEGEYFSKKKNNKKWINFPIGTSYSKKWKYVDVSNKYIK